MDFHNTLQAVNLLPNAVRPASVFGADFDIRQLIGRGKLLLDAGAQGSGITTAIKLQDSPDLTQGAYYKTDGTANLSLNKATTGKTSVACKFTQSGACQIKTIALSLKQIGTIAAGKKLTLSIESDSSGPDGTPLGTAGTVLCSTISADAYGWITFTFATPVDLADSTVYWLVLTSDYDASDTNYVNWSVVTVGSAGTVATFVTDTWTAVTTQKALFYAMEYVFSDVTTVTLTNVTNAASFQTTGVVIDGLGPILRAALTISGGTATGGTSLTLIGRPQVI